MSQKASIIRGYSPQYADPIHVAAGERVFVGREDPEFPGWKWCRGPDGREGWVPVELLSDTTGDARVLSDYSARELAVMPGEEVAVEDARHDWLLARNKKGKRGWIPASHAELL
jgi:SH3-like domain-containing protein